MTGTGDRPARVAEGHVIAALLNSMMNSRRLSGFSPALCPRKCQELTQCSNSESFDRLISRDLHSQRHSETERLCGLEIDDKLEHGRLRDR